MCQSGHVRGTGPQHLLGLDHNQQLRSFPYFQHWAPQRLGHRHILDQWLRIATWEIQQQALALTGDTQGAGSALKLQPLTGLFINVEQHVGTGQGCMTAQRHFSGRGKPANLPAFGVGNHERSLGQIMFSGNLLHQLIGEPAIKAIDYGRVTGKGAVAESIDLMEFKLHGTTLCMAGRRACPVSTGGHQRQNRPISSIQIQPRAMAANFACVCSASTAADNSTSRPRRPALTKIVSKD